MNITETITTGMTAQEKEVFFNHQTMRHKQEVEKLAAEKEQMITYRHKLIECVLKNRPDIDPEKVKHMSIRKLEQIW